MLSKSSVSFYAQDQHGYTHSILIAEDVPTYPTASNSVLLSLAAFISWKYPNLPHPHYPSLPLNY